MRTLRILSGIAVLLVTLHFVHILRRSNQGTRHAVDAALWNPTLHQTKRGHLALPCSLLLKGTLIRRPHLLNTGQQGLSIG